ncbi:MAG: AIR carboxylase family protein [Candidatus Bathyarchaeia archaeon]
MAQGKVVLILGSGSDEDFARPIIRLLEVFGIRYEVRVASAHRTPRKLLDILQEHEAGESLVYITVAGLSNALSGMVDANTIHPVIACPPLSTCFAGGDILSSLRMPKGVAPLVVLEPESAAVAAAKILAIKDLELKTRLEFYQKEARDRTESEDQRLRR